jgi:hypothetical protein
MIVDCHTHIDSAARGTGLNERLAAAETVDVCIVLGAGEGRSEEVNKELSEYVGKHQEKLVGFAIVDPPKDDVSVKNLTYIRDKLGLKGTVLHCCQSGFLVLGPMRFLTMLSHIFLMRLRGNFRA